MRVDEMDTTHFLFCDQKISETIKNDGLLPHSQWEITSHEKQADEIVHHFSCGYQAAESQFMALNANLLSEYLCPKCQKPLRHLGVDYDKPGLIYRCEACTHENYETKVAFKCLSCQQEGEADDTARLKILSYELTPLGKKAALNHEASIFNMNQYLEERLSMLRLLNYKSYLIDQYDEFLKERTENEAKKAEQHVQENAYLKTLDQNLVG